MLKETNSKKFHQNLNYVKYNYLYIYYQAVLYYINYVFGSATIINVATTNNFCFDFKNPHKWFTISYPLQEKFWHIRRDYLRIISSILLIYFGLLLNAYFC